MTHVEIWLTEKQRNRFHGDMWQWIESHVGYQSHSKNPRGRWNYMLLRDTVLEDPKADRRYLFRFVFDDDAVALMFKLTWG